jgi:hypothetical protein
LISLSQRKIARFPYENYAVPIHGFLTGYQLILLDRLETSGLYCPFGSGPVWLVTPAVPDFFRFIHTGRRKSVERMRWVPDEESEPKYPKK